jgi:hypothetical protein
MYGQTTSSGFSGSNLGIQFDANHLMGTKNISMFSQDSNELPQSSQEGNLFGVGISYGFQFGSDATKFQHWALVPVLGVRMGTKNDTENHPTLTHDTLEYESVTLSRKTKTTEIFLSVPMRWYVQERGQLGDGFFVEAGLVLAHSQQDVDITLDGTYAGQAIQYPYKVKFTKNRGGYLVGLGSSLPIGNHGLDFGIEYLGLPSSEPLPSQSLRLYVQWYF